MLYKVGEICWGLKNLKWLELSAQTGEAHTSRRPLAMAGLLYSLRAQFGVEDVPFNQIHGSSSVQDATKEVEYFFPTEHTLGVIKPNALSEKGVINCVYHVHSMCGIY